MNSAEIYDSGHALMIYHPDANKRVWRYRDEQFELPSGAVEEISHPELYTLARIEDVRKAA